MEEPESAALETTVQGRGLLASALVLNELPRAWSRLGQDPAAPAVHALLRRLDLVDLDRELLRRAGALPGPALRSLDAVHLACALRVQDAVKEFLGYDERLLEAARAAGLRTRSPR